MSLWCLLTRWILLSVSLSPLFAGSSLWLSCRCFRSITLFLTSSRRSSGSSSVTSCALVIALIFLPVIALTSGTLCSSRRRLPIWLGVCPSLASLTMRSSISLLLSSLFFGFGRPTGRWLFAFPRLRECIRAIVLYVFLWLEGSVCCPPASVSFHQHSSWLFLRNESLFKRIVFSLCGGTIYF